MLTPLPERIEVERAVTTGRVYAGVLPLANLPRLTSLLADAQGEVSYELKFGRNAIGQRSVSLQADAALPLTCQATLDRFEFPVHIDAHLGFVKDEADDAGLPEGYEAALTDDGMVDPAALIEDELILAIPVVPRKPDAVLKQPAAKPEEAADEQRPNPFAALTALKQQSSTDD
jgi:uncharacterized protein